MFGEDLGSLLCPGTFGADEDNLPSPRYFTSSILERGERDVVGAGNLPLRDFVGFAHVKEEQRRIIVKTWRQCRGADRRNKVGAHRKSVGAGRPSDVSRTTEKAYKWLISQTLTCNRLVR